jgi:hypothetical protein
MKVAQDGFTDVVNCAGNTARAEDAIEIKQRVNVVG